MEELDQFIIGRFSAAIQWLSSNLKIGTLNILRESYSGLLVMLVTSFTCAFLQHDNMTMILTVGLFMAAHRAILNQIKQLNADIKRQGDDDIIDKYNRSARTSTRTGPVMRFCMVGMLAASLFAMMKNPAHLFEMLPDVLLLLLIVINLYTVCVPQHKPNIQAHTK